MRILISISLLIICNLALAQQTVISTGKIKLGIRVKKPGVNSHKDIINTFSSDGSESEEYYDIYDLCDGFDENGLPINLVLPVSSQIILFLPDYKKESKNIYLYSDNGTQVFGINNFNYVYKGDSVGFLGIKSHSAGSTLTLLVDDTGIGETVIPLSEAELSFIYHVDPSPALIREIYLVEEIEKMIRNLDSDPFGTSSRDYDAWLGKNYVDRLDERGIPVNPTFPHYTESIIFTLDSHNYTEIRLYGKNKGKGYETLSSGAKRNVFTIKDLSPGSYMLAIENAATKYGNRNKVYTFSIKRSFWHQHGYLLIILIPSLFFPFFIFRIYTKTKIDRLTRNKQLSEAELKAIRAQLNPHFLFNALNAIQNLVNKQDTDNANQYIARLSKLMRKVLAQSDDTMHSLNEEIEISTLYLELEKMRTPFTYEIKMAPEVGQNMLVPSMILQPYLENAVIHGILNGSGSHIQLSIYRNQNLCILEISDNGTGSTKNTGNGKGLKLGEERFDIINRQSDHQVKTSVSTKAIPEGGYCVTIKLPIDL